eukprot:7652548-Alexandrium_andersonii.AAC.1
MAALTRQAHAANDWSIVAEAWRAAMVSHRQFVLSRSDKRIFFSVYVTPYAVLAWPVRRVGTTAMSLVATCNELEWVVVTDLE